MKEYSYIEDLLERYFDGLTTEAEEARLQEFFRRADVPPHLQAEAEMFRAMDLAGMEGRLGRAVDSWNDSNTSFTQSSHSAGVRSFASLKMTVPRIPLLRIAAGIALLLAFGWKLLAPNAGPRDTCATPEEAYAETQRALAMVSAALNKGVAPLQTLQETTAKAEQHINEQLNKFNRQ